MQVKAIQHGLHIVEVPVDTRARIGKSKISGTVRGVLGAGFGILSMIAKLRWRQMRQRTVGDGLVPSRFSETALPGAGDHKGRPYADS